MLSVPSPSRWVSELSMTRPLRGMSTFVLIFWVVPSPSRLNRLSWMMTMDGLRKLVSFVDLVLVLHFGQSTLLLPSSSSLWKNSLMHSSRRTPPPLSGIWTQTCMLGSDFVLVDPHSVHLTVLVTVPISRSSIPLACCSPVSSSLMTSSNLISNSCESCCPPLNIPKSFFFSFDISVEGSIVPRGDFFISERRKATCRVTSPPSCCLLIM
mmetsp:Transcript_25564/g.60828  ORF Transcript_25564/g.60828 Transcript_25564/m.60828 type:complete len:210 (-) Transcript_25564:289-918(-)